MRRARAKNDGEGYYHLVSRCAFGKMAFADAEKEMFVGMMRRVAAFSGIEVLAYCVMTNHFHVLAHVPRPVELTEAVLLERVAILYGAENAEALKGEWEEFRARGRASRVEAEQAALRRRMGDISPFMQCLKQRFSVWYRSRHEGHEGTLWQGRFGSTFVGTGEALMAVAAYIDLNPVRAGIVEDPEDYGWSGYGAAVAGDRAAMLGLARVADPDARAKDFESMLDDYRKLLYVRGAGDIDPGKIKAVLEAGGKLELPLALRCRIRAMTHGFAVGTREFVEAAMAAHADQFPLDRKTGASPIGRCPCWNGFRFCSARRIQKNPVTLPA